MKRKLSLTYLLLVLPLSLNACATDFPSTYSAEAIEATVVDADSHQPLAGVIVTANWALSSGNPGGSTPAGQMMVLETTTDKDGVFRFPAWGPLKRKQGLFMVDDPQLLLFKSAYEYRRLNNYREGVALEGLWRAPVRRSQWNGRTIELKPFKGTLSEQSKALLDFSKNVESFTVRHPQPCNWLKVPRSLSVMMRERIRLEREGVMPVWDRTVDKQLLDGEKYFVKACGESAVPVLQELKNK